MRGCLNEVMCHVLTKVCVQFNYCRLTHDAHFVARRCVVAERRSLETQNQSSREIKEALIRTSTQLEQTYIRSRDEQSQIQRLQQVVTSQRDLIKQLAARLVAANLPLSPDLVASIDACLEIDEL